MRQFVYIIKSSTGLNTRFVGLLSKLAKGYGDTVISVTKGGETAKTSQLMKLTCMGVKQGDQVVVSADGPSQDRAIVAARAFFEEHL